MRRLIPLDILLSGGEGARGFEVPPGTGDETTHLYLLPFAPETTGPLVWERLDFEVLHTSPDCSSSRRKEHT